MSRKRTLGDVIEIDDDEDDDDEVIVIDTKVASTCTQSLPRRTDDMDEASWQLIQELARADRGLGGEGAAIQDDAKIASNLHDMESYRYELEYQGQAAAARIQEAEDAKFAASLNDDDERKMMKFKDTSKKGVLASLTKGQMIAINNVTKRAKTAHEQCYPLLQEKVKILGFKDTDLEACLHYVRDEAPIIIHLTWETLKLLSQDTKYRNLFETNCTGGSKNVTARRAWETRLFGCDAYPEHSRASHRPKYGCLNLSGDIKGSRKAIQYGPLFLTLEPHVRFRSTFSDQDSSSLTCSVATNEYYAHVLYKFSDVDLCAVLSVSRVSGSPSNCWTYKEVQIHGPITLATDIQALSLPGKESGCTPEQKMMVESFQKQTGCNIFWQDDLLGL